MLSKRTSSKPASLGVRRVGRERCPTRDRQAQGGEATRFPTDFEFPTGRNEHLPPGTLNVRRSLQCTKRVARLHPPAQTDCTMERASGVVSPKEREKMMHKIGKQKTTPPPPSPIRLGRKRGRRKRQDAARARLLIHTSSSSALPSFFPNRRRPEVGSFNVEERDGKAASSSPSEGTGEVHFSALYINCRLVCCRLQAGARARQ